MIRTETQQEILELIRNRDADTVVAICGHLGITPTAVRRHLDGLEAGGYINHSAVRDGASRPHHSYDLTAAGHGALPKRYDTLLMALLAEIHEMTGEQLTGLNGIELLDQLIRRIAQKSSPDSRTSLNSADRIQALRDVLVDLDFSPDIQESITGVTISLRNCPFREVALRDRAVCEFDRVLIGDFLAVIPDRDSCIADGARSCVYSLSTPPSN